LYNLVTRHGGGEPLAGVPAKRLQVMLKPVERARDYYTRRAQEHRELADQAIEATHREAHITIANRYDLYAQLDLTPPLQVVGG
jgi:hypothetical protein